MHATSEIPRRTPGIRIRIRIRTPGKGKHKQAEQGTRGKARGEWGNYAERQ